MRTSKPISLLWLRPFLAYIVNFSSFEAQNGKNVLAPLKNSGSLSAPSSTPWSMVEMAYQQMPTLGERLPYQFMEGSSCLNTIDGGDGGDDLQLPYRSVHGRKLFPQSYSAPNLETPFPSLVPTSKHEQPRNRRHFPTIGAILV